MLNSVNNTEEKINALREKIEPLWERYEEKRKAYEDAVSEFNNLRSNAMAGTEPRYVHEYSMNASTYQLKIKSAMNDWVVEGHKNEVEAVLSRIDLLGRESG